MKPSSALPKETSTRPIMREEMPKAAARITECSTALSLENAMRRIPPTRIAIQITISKIIKISSRFFYSFIFKCIGLKVCFLNKDDLFFGFF